MTDITFRSDMTVELIDHMGDDRSVIRAARVSTGTDWKSDGAIELLEFLMKNRHGTPFEHNAFTFRIEAPIFVWREFHRHRIGFSYNEESSRYTQLKPVFYVPAPERNLQQVGKPGHYEFVPGSELQQIELAKAIRANDRDAYERYERMLEEGIAREVARMVLPVNIYSACYVTCNARSLMSFLSLRTKHPDAAVPSFPQREIEMVAEGMESYFRDLMPITYTAFNKFGRVSP